MSHTNKTTATDTDVYDFLATVDDAQKRQDSLTLIEMMQEVTGYKPVMWGPSIIGFDRYHYKYDSGHEGEYCVVGFSPRKNALVLYLLNGYEEAEPQLEKLGKYTIGKSCLYIKRLSDIDLNVLREMIATSYAQTKAMWPDRPTKKNLV